MTNKHPIHHTFAPLADKRHCLRAFLSLISPWAYRQGASIEALARGLGDRLHMDAFLFASGRESLLALFQAMQLAPGDEIIVQGYTCVVVPNAIRAAGGKVVYADIDRNTLNLDPISVARRINPRTRAIICQHTFGIPAPAEELRALCDRHSLALIEDCAHVMPDAYGPDEIGRFGDFLMFSFGRDKAISGVGGGAILSRHPMISRGLTDIYLAAPSLPVSVIMRLMLYPLIYAIAKPFYAQGFGKAFLALCGRLGLLMRITNEHEKRGKMSPVVHKIPNACAYLAFGQWQQLQALNDHRRSLTRLYLEEGRARGWFLKDEHEETLPLAVKAILPMQKFPIFVPDAPEIRAVLKRENIHLDDGWTGCVVCPPSVDAATTGYEAGVGPAAERVARQILSLPTHPTMTEEQAKTLVELLDPLLRHTPPPSHDAVRT